MLVETIEAEVGTMQADSPVNFVACDSGGDVNDSIACTPGLGCD